MLTSPGEITPPRLVARDNERVRCVLCHDSLDALWVECRGCSAVLHEECARSLERCPTLGCGTLLPAKASVRGHGPRRAARALASRAVAVARLVPAALARVIALSLWGKLTLALAVLLVTFFAYTLAGVRPDDLLQEADRAVLEKRPGDAIALAEQGLALGSGPNVGFLLVEARAHEQRREWKDAIRFLDRALVLAPERSDLFVERGQLKRTLKDDLGAENDARLALALGSSAAAWALRAETACDHGTFESAAEDARAAIKADERDARGWYVLGRALRGRHELREALAAFDQAVARNAELDGLSLDRADARLEAKDYAGAEADASRAIEGDASSFAAWTVRAAARLRLGKHALARDDARAALEREKKSALAWEVEGIAELELGRAKEAKESLETALGLDSHLREAYLAHGRAQLELGDLDDAQADLEHFVDIAPDSPRVPEARALLARIEKRRSP